MIKKIFKYVFFFSLLIISICLCGYGYSKLNTSLEISSVNNISLYDSKEELVFQGNGTSKWVSL